jgi:hypothetical protein
VIGMAGQSLSQNLEKKKPDWIEYVDDSEYGYSRITTTYENGQHQLHMEYYNNQNVLKDHFTLSK